MTWAYGFLTVAALLATWRVYVIFKRTTTQHGDDWDEQLVKNWRAQGGIGFAPVNVDFFFGVPDLEHCQQLSSALQADGCSVDFRVATSEGATGYTLHAVKAVRISVTEMQEHSARYRRLAAVHEASYDSWATEGVTRQVATNQRLRPRGVPPSAFKR